MKIVHTSDRTLVSTTVHGYVQRAIELAKKYTTHGQVVDKDQHFYGDAPDWPTMVRRAYDGYNAKAIAGARDLILNAITAHRAQPSLAYSGDEFSVQAYVQGSRRCFWRHEDEPRRPLVHLIYRGNTNAGTRAEAYINHGGAIAAIASALDAVADMRVTATYTTRRVFNGGAVMCIGVKDPSEAMDVARLGVTTHPSFHRRVSFTWYGALFPSLGMQHCSAIGSAVNRRDLISDDDFFAFINSSGEDLVVDLPAADDYAFRSDASTTQWVADQIAKIQACINSGQKHYKI